MKTRHRVLYNQDCTNLFAVTKEPLTPEHVDRMVDEVAQGGADVFLANPNAQRVNYPSRVWQTFWDGYTPGRREFFGPVPENSVPGREAWVAQMKRLVDSGCDYLAHVLARCRSQHITPGVSIRMNDMHDVPWPGSNLFSRFYMDHPELRLANPSSCGWSATGLNYEHAQVRAHYMALIKEIVDRYDFDVLELDFLRFHCYFPRTDFARHCGLMTEFVREVRTSLRSSGRDIELMVRLPATPAGAYELGFDAATWASQGLVDGISAGAFLAAQWNLGVADYRALVGERVAVYACTDYIADRRAGLPERELPRSPEFLRGFAAGHLAAGADGIEMFNFFCTREAQSPHDPAFSALRELASLETLRGRPKTYTLMSGWMVGEVDGALQVPVEITQGQSRTMEMLLATEPATAKVAIEFLFAGGVQVHPERLWLRVNSTPVGPAQAVRDFGEGDKKFTSAAFTLAGDALRDGRNTVVIRNEGESLTLLSLDVKIG